MRNDTLDEVTRYIRKAPVHRIRGFQNTSGGMYGPTANVRSVEDLYEISEPAAAGRWELNLDALEAVNETILVESQVNRVSMPSAVPVGGWLWGLGAIRAGRV